MDNFQPDVDDGLVVPCVVVRTIFLHVTLSLILFLILVGLLTTTMVFSVLS